MIFLLYLYAVYKFSLTGEGKVFMPTLLLSPAMIPTTKKVQLLEGVFGGSLDQVEKSQKVLQERTDDLVARLQRYDFIPASLITHLQKHRFWGVLQETRGLYLTWQEEEKREKMMRKIEQKCSPEDNSDLLFVVVNTALLPGDIRGDARRSMGNAILFDEFIGSAIKVQDHQGTDISREFFDRITCGQFWEMLPYLNKQQIREHSYANNRKQSPEKRGSCPGHAIRLFFDRDISQGGYKKYLPQGIDLFRRNGGTRRTFDLGLLATLQGYEHSDSCIIHYVGILKKILVEKKDAVPSDVATALVDAYARYLVDQSHTARHLETEFVLERVDDSSLVQKFLTPRKIAQHIARAKPVPHYIQADERILQQVRQSLKRDDVVLRGNELQIPDYHLATHFRLHNQTHRVPGYRGAVEGIVSIDFLFEFDYVYEGKFCVQCRDSASERGRYNIAIDLWVSDYAKPGSNIGWGPEYYTKDTQTEHPRSLSDLLSFYKKKGVRPCLLSQMKKELAALRKVNPEKEGYVVD